jgi:hypothetical protein
MERLAARPAARGGAATVRAVGSVQRQLGASARRCGARGGEKWRRNAYRALAGGGSGPVIGRRHASAGGKGVVAGSRQSRRGRQRGSISAQCSGEEALEPGRSGRRLSSVETATSFGIQRDRGEPGRRGWRPDGARLGSSIARLGVALGTCATEGMRRRRGRPSKWRGGCCREGRNEEQYEMEDGWLRTTGSAWG